METKQTWKEIRLKTQPKLQFHYTINDHYLLIQCPIASSIQLSTPDGYDEMENKFGWKKPIHSIPLLNSNKQTNNPSARLIQLLSTNFPFNFKRHNTAKRKPSPSRNNPLQFHYATPFENNPSFGPRAREETALDNQRAENWQGP